MTTNNKKKNQTIDDYATKTTTPPATTLPREKLLNVLEKVLEDTTGTPLEHAGTKKQEQTPQQQQKQSEKKKLQQYKTLHELVTSKETRAYVKKRLAYKNWTLFIFKNHDRFTLRVTARRGDKTYTKINIQHTDTKYVRELLEELENALRKLGINLSQIS